jgi:hypothetical protein
MCHPIRFSKLISLINIVNFSSKASKRDKLIEIANMTCHEKLENSYRVKVLNDLLKKQKLRSSAFVMYVNLHYDAKKDLIIIDYPFYPRSTH